MSNYDLNDDADLYEKNDKKNNNHPKKLKDKRKYTDNELKELMGVDRDIYKRKNRRVRRK